MESPKVCITGVSGFLGAWVLKTFLESKESFSVRATVRDPDNKEKMAPLEESLGDFYFQTEFVAANLMDSESIDKAIEGCEYVVHTASPFPVVAPKNEDDLIKPAVEGTRAVLEACKKHKVKRLVVTSSIVAVQDFARDAHNSVVTEEDWLEDFDRSTAYPKSKTLAEKSIWDFIDSLPDDEKFDAVTINPGFILGPLLTKGGCSSAEVLGKILEGGYPGLPNIYTSLVDVRDVAEAHLRAITQEPPSGRYICSEGCYGFDFMGKVLNEEFRKQGYKPNTKKIKYCFAKLGSLFLPEVKSVIKQWGIRVVTSNEKIKEKLGMEFRDINKTITEMGYSLIENGFVRDKRK